MQVGELFISLGITGADKTVAQVSMVEKGLKDTASTALETKVAIVGAMYALQQFFSQSGQAGTNLTNFSAVVGEGTQTLQQYQYAARQVGASNEEMESTFKNLQNVAAKAAINQGVPSGLAQVARATGKNITSQDMQNFSAHPEMLLQKLQEYAQKEKNIGLRNLTLKSFGLGDAMIAALSRNAFTSTQLAKAPTYSEREINQLDRANIAWSNLSTNIQMAVGHFNALHGVNLAQDVGGLVKDALSLANSFLKLADAIKLFQGIDLIFKGWGLIFDGISSSIDKITDLKDDKKISSSTVEPPPWVIAVLKVAQLSKDGNLIFPNKPGKLLPDASADKSGAFTDMIDLMLKIIDVEADSTPLDAKASEKFQTEKKPNSPNILRLVIPPSPIVPSGANVTPPVKQTSSTTGPNQNINVAQNLNFQHPGLESKSTGDSVKKAVRDAFRQLSSQVQVS